ncbi:hypothetical protein TEA_019888 [Camellia sinensis var. sinensis]|uniref:NAC domain-containing protein n=1 Tax=Camellia sinensis var. sinensis TaxID=542762 RepID=A0A4S4D9L9_CAMSN|nr:hypothetical protein TEA_019888 [Camellia sinensis var. sinensis]
MEVEKMSINMNCASKHDDDDDDVQLPGFRFHPTDEELVGFYLRRKVEKRPISIELIKQVDIYKFDPWDLPKASNVGDKEWYFFCKRGRKYRNSIRPNRVTGSGFWKATGIDRPIYSNGGEGRECIGLKKSLEVWTLCRILKRNVSYRKCIPDWRELSAKRNPVDASSKTCSIDESDSHEGFNIDFRAPVIRQNEKKLFASHLGETNQRMVGQLSSISHQTPTTGTYSSFYSHDVNEFIKFGDWDELRSVVEFSVDPFPM